MTTDSEAPPCQRTTNTENELGVDCPSDELSRPAQADNDTDSNATHDQASTGTHNTIVPNARPEVREAQLEICDDYIKLLTGTLNGTARVMLSLAHLQKLFKVFWSQNLAGSEYRVHSYKTVAKRTLEALQRHRSKVGVSVILPSFRPKITPKPGIQIKKENWLAYRYAIVNNGKAFPKTEPTPAQFFVRKPDLYVHHIRHKRKAPALGKNSVLPIEVPVFKKEERRPGHFVESNKGTPFIHGKEDYSMIVFLNNYQKDTSWPDAGYPEGCKRQRISDPAGHESEESDDEQFPDIVEWDPSDLPDYTRRQLHNTRAVGAIEDIRGNGTVIVRPYHYLSDRILDSKHEIPVEWVSDSEMFEVFMEKKWLRM
ncbi:hypothetical protein BC832DRAFT_616691 [Gaertneriomyces semiglobifer]|nr:hypothetical protein BC832DRAFT_616691 [Gaertneriomyces semiglobifer]